jgi:F-type H+-transporting ATPase subunit b
MEQVLQDLGGLILKALPTFILIVLLHFYLKGMFFRPLERVLKARYEATEGARKLAQESLAKASEKASEYENALRAARLEIYREQEEFRQRWRQEQAQAVQQSRQKAEAMVRDANAQLQTELAEAKRSLQVQSESLADRIVEQILHRRPV